jgi:putative membrane protein
MRAILENAQRTLMEELIMSPTHSLDRLVSMSCAAALVLLGACRGDQEGTADTTGTTAGAGAAAPAAAPALGDPQIAHVAVTANSIDSAMGALARPKAQNAQVRDFAQAMIRDHGAVNKQAVALVTRLNVTPAENDVSRQLQQGAEQARTDLGGKTGADFDRAYIDHEVRYHQTVLDALDNTLIPGSQNTDLKALLQQARPNFAAHLERARSIQGTLGRQ